MKGANMEGIYLYKERVETIKQMIEELGVSL
jgi:coenzyme F420-reducing hydrogenase delta subunit